ncbi:MAG: acyl--CoA ligase [Candidatus Latescibacteria bacterium]|nr:acyl--CoA ligase [Candidatus Latescibacterota bacterium]
MYDKPSWVLHETLWHAVEKYSAKTALVVEGIEYTYATLLHDTRCLATLLIDAGVQRGDRVAIFLDNTYAAVLSLYATLFAGGVFIIINPQTKSNKLKYILADSETKILISDSHLFSRLLPVFRAPSFIKGFFYTLTDDTSAPPEKDGCLSGELFTTVKQMEPVANLGPSLPTDLAALIYTSGSTGNPKGVMMRHHAMLFSAQSISYYLRLDHSHTIINVLPLAFDYGLYQVLMSVVQGATLVLERSFAYPAQIVKNIIAKKITVFPGVPTIYATLIGMHRRKPLTFSSVKRITNTAASLPSEYTKELHQIFPNALIYRMYGLTECKRVCYLEPELADKKPGSVGKAIPGTETFIISDAGHRCGPNEPGILHVRGPHIMAGYWKAPELSEKMLLSGYFPGERILCTQDRFKMDEDGDLYFIGRSDDIIKSRGEKVSPVEVENVLLSIKGIREAAVIGVDDELLGQAIKAFVALDDASITEHAIRKYCTDHLENFMSPKYIEIRSSLPKTESGKILKKTLT